MTIMKNNKIKQEDAPVVYFTLAGMALLLTIYSMYSEYGIGFIKIFISQFTTAGPMDSQQKTFIFGVFLSLSCTIFLFICGIHQVQKDKKKSP